MQPMLSAKWPDHPHDQAELFEKYKLVASPKLDGVRCLFHIREARALTRSGRPFPNSDLRRAFNKLSEVLCDHRGFDGVKALDGELIVGEPTGSHVWGNTLSVISRTTSSIDNLRFWVFDSIVAENARDFGWANRNATTKRWIENDPEADTEFIRWVPHRPITVDTLDQEVEDAVNAGYEGLMVRSLDGKYKHGRATVPSGLLYKIKPWITAEAVIEDAVELMHNTNPEARTPTGKLSRSKRAEGLVPGGTLGALILDNGVQLGTGFTNDQRASLWANHQRGSLVGFTVKYKHLPGISDGLVRHPVFLELL